VRADVFFCAEEAPAKIATKTKTDVIARNLFMILPAF
jgi:hypothetical protein